MSHPMLSYFILESISYTCQMYDFYITSALTKEALTVILYVIYSYTDYDD